MFSTFGKQRVGWGWAGRKKASPTHGRRGFEVENTGLEPVTF